MRRFFLSFLWVALPLLLMSCSRKPMEDDPIARVNGKLVTVREYLDLYESLKPRDVALSDSEKPHLRNLVVQTLVRRAVILTSAESQNISVPEAELLKGIQEFKGGYSEQLFRESLIEGMVQEADWRDRVREMLLIQKLFEASRPQVQKPNLEEALQYYQDNTRLFFKTAEATAFHIVVGDEKVLQEIRSQIVSNKLSFLEAARKHSTGPEAQADARLVVEKGVLPEPLDQYLFEAPLQQLSPVIKSPYGYHLLRVLKRSPAVSQDFKEVRDKIMEHLFEERKQAWLQKFEETLIRSADIEYNRDLIRSL